MKREKRDRGLWHRLEGYSFHERPLTRSMVAQLEDETGHSTDVCYTLIEEYRRFMYLIASTGKDLSPSPIVDVVWRLHISDRKAYFYDFCPRIIGRTIYHPEDLPRFQDDPAYERALDYYAQEFGRPQVQYWPEPDVASVRMSSVIMWIVGLAAFLMALLFGSYVFVIFGALVISISMFLQWKYSPLPLENVTSEDS